METPKIKKISKGLPPNIEKIKAVFPYQPNTVFSYGDTVYTQDNENLSPDLLVHEAVHAKQHGDNPEAWWDKYIADTDFRLEQEIQAYAAQYAFARKVMPTKKSDHLLQRISEDVSSPQYGTLLTTEQARTKIRLAARGLLETQII